MSKIRLHGSSSGYTEIAPVAASGNNTLTLPNDGTIISKDSNGAVGVTSITVGTGVTLSSSGDVAFAGIATGNASGLTGINTPSFSARMTGTSQQLTASTEAAIIFNTEDHDTDDAYNNSTGEFTVPAGKGGVYHISVNFGVDDLGAVGNIIRLRVLKNDNLLYGFRGQNVCAFANYIVTTSLNGAVTLAAGDVIKCMGYQDSNVNASEPIENEATHFSMFRLAI